MNDEKYMRRCLQLAANGIQGARPNPMVGAVIVAPRPSSRTAEVSVIGEGYHVRCGKGHAEVNAFASVRPEDEPLLLFSEGLSILQVLHIIDYHKRNLKGKRIIKVSYIKS